MVDDQRKNYESILNNIENYILKRVISKHDPPKLCDDTRLTIKGIILKVLEATITSRKYAGVDYFIARIPMRTTELPFELQRL